MYMGKKLTVLWDEGELGNSVMLFTCSCCCCCPSQGALPTQCPIGHHVRGVYQFIHYSEIEETISPMDVLVADDLCQRNGEEKALSNDDFSCISIHIFRSSMTKFSPSKDVQKNVVVYFSTYIAKAFLSACILAGSLVIYWPYLPTHRMLQSLCHCKRHRRFLISRCNNNFPRLNNHKNIIYSNT